MEDNITEGQDILAEEEYVYPIGPDEPIYIQEEDCLGRYPFAEQLTLAIVNYKRKNCLCIGIEGSWGSGKTSILNMVELNIEGCNAFISETISSEQNCVQKIKSKLGDKFYKENHSKQTFVLKFNPWLYTDSLEMISQFLNELSILFNVKIRNYVSEFIDKHSDKIKTVGNVTNDLAELSEKYSTFAMETGQIENAVTARLVELGFLATSEISGQISGEGGKETTTKSLRYLKEKIVKQLEEIDFKILVIIDDLDRLPNEEIRAVFQLIKSIADFPNLIYLVAYDREIVVGALDGVQKKDGASYLEKIVQLPFVSPPILPTTLQKILDEKIKQIIGLELFQKAEIGRENSVYGASLPFF